jgi:hypothetical protein
MKIFTKIILDKKNNIIEEHYYNYFGPISECGIHFDYKSTKGAKAMAKQAKREKKLIERRAKKKVKAESKGIKKKEEDKTIPIDHIINLEDLTRPDNK